MYKTLVSATPKFFKRTLPVEKQMEFIARQAFTENIFHIFLRDNEPDSDNPSRIRICLTVDKAECLIEELQKFVKNEKSL